MGMTFENFIVLDARTSLKSIKASKGTYEWTDTGSRIYNVGKPVPVIQNQRCIGIATVKEYTVTVTSTTIIFSFDEISDRHMLDAYYALYRMSATMNRSNDDVYNTDDILIPGMVAGNPTMKSSKYRDDDDDEDDEDNSLSAALKKINRRR